MTKKKLPDVFHSSNTSSVPPPLYSFSLAKPYGFFAAAPAVSAVNVLDALEGDPPPLPPWPRPSPDVVAAPAVDPLVDDLRLFPDAVLALLDVVVLAADTVDVRRLLLPLLLRDGGGPNPGMTIFHCLANTI